MDRRLLLQRGANAVGATWSRHLYESVKKQGRAVAGGWPGTMLEARARVAQHLEAELSTLGMAPLRKAEIDEAAAATYARAKKDWLDVERSTKAAQRASLGRD